MIHNRQNSGLLQKRTNLDTHVPEVGDCVFCSLLCMSLSCCCMNPVMFEEASWRRSVSFRRPLIWTLRFHPIVSEGKKKADCKCVSTTQSPPWSRREILLWIWLTSVVDTDFSFFVFVTKGKENSRKTCENTHSRQPDVQTTYYYHVQTWKPKHSPWYKRHNSVNPRKCRKILLHFTYSSESLRTKMRRPKP